MHKNFKSVEKTVFGRGSYNQLGSIIDDRRNENDGFAVFLVDDYFDLLESILPLKENIGRETVIIPLLNGVDSYDNIKSIFSKGVCFESIFSMISSVGEI